MSIYSSCKDCQDCDMACKATYTHQNDHTKGIYMYPQNNLSQNLNNKDLATDQMMGKWGLETHTDGIYDIKVGQPLVHGMILAKE